jgi:hypothetical protein
VRAPVPVFGNILAIGVTACGDVPRASTPNGQPGQSGRRGERNREPTGASVTVINARTGKPGGADANRAAQRVVARALAEVAGGAGPGPATKVDEPQGRSHRGYEAQQNLIDVVRPTQ